MGRINTILLDFERKIGLGPTYAAELLGMAYSSYAQVRSGARPLKAYTQRHIEAITMLPAAKLQILKRRHIRREHNPKNAAR